MHRRLETVLHVSDRWQRAALRRGAVRYAGHGWPVVPGAPFHDGRYACGPLCPTVACHPATEQWEQLASTKESTVDSWWRAGSYSVLLATGRLFDAIEVPEQLGRAIANPAALGPVAVTAAGRWMFLVRAGESLRSELAARLDVVLHGRGSWIPAPPTRTPQGRVRWVVAPEDAGWRMAEPHAAQRMLAVRLGQLGPPPTFASSTPALRRAA
jgi:hypothetical protein